MRRMRLLTVAVTATLGVSAVAYAQSGGNAYTVTGSVQSHGGSKAKPKAGGFSFGFTIKDPAGNIPKVVKTFQIAIEGTRVNTKVARNCTPAAMDRAQSDSVCPKGSLIGTGKIGDAVGVSGQPFSSAAYCDLPVKIYNSGSNAAALWIKAGPPNCLAAVAQSVPARWVTTAKGTELQFTVPDGLRHQLGLDLAVTSATTSFKKMTKKIKGKTVGYFESIGCKDGKRDITASFTGEDGVSSSATTTLSRC